MRVAWTARKSNQSVNLEYSLEGLKVEEKATTEDEMVGWHH